MEHFLIISLRNCDMNNLTKFCHSQKHFLFFALIFYLYYITYNYFTYYKMI